MKYFFSIFFLLSIQVSLYAHDGGHGQSEVWIVNNAPLVAEFLKYEDNEVFFLDNTHKLLSYRLEELSPKHQELLLARHKNIVQINQPLHFHNGKSHLRNIYPYAIGLGALLVILSFLFYFGKNKKYHFAYGVIGLSIVAVIVACSNGDGSVSNSETQDPTSHLSFLTSLFGNFSNITTDSDSDWFYIEGNGLPEHDMMVGITNWQQQVPIDQSFTGDNRWQIPLHPVVASTPRPVENEFFRNAIAISINGIPLYHPMTNAGADAFASGQLDNWGGHSGRADDYHYHLPPTHLESVVGSDVPVAYALDGFPIYGETSEPLDKNLGRYNDDGGYQYHTVTDYPYFMANLVGEVTLTETVEGSNTVYEIVPQPRTQGARPSTSPLGGTLEITDFENTGSDAYKLTYVLNKETYIIEYSWDNSDLYTYVFTDPKGNSTTEKHQR